MAMSLSRFSLWNLGYNFLWPTKSLHDKGSERRKRTVSDSLPSKSLTGTLNNWESNLVWLQALLIWEKPATSAFFIFLFHALYWFIVWNSTIIVSSMSMLALSYFLHNQWVTVIWPEISVPLSDSPDSEEWTPVHPNVLSAPEINKHLEKVIALLKKRKSRLLQLRKREPGKFCIIFALIFSLGIVIGFAVPDVWLMSMLITGITVLPGIVHRLPRKTYKKLQKYCVVLVQLTDVRSSTKSKDDLADFLPEETSDIQTLLTIPLSPSDPPPLEKRKAKKNKIKRAGRKSVNDTGSFAEGMSGEEFPTIIDDEIQESELELHIEPVEHSQENVNSGVSGPPMDINFVSSHFGGSSDEEEEFENGLSFQQSFATQNFPVEPVSNIADGLDSFSNALQTKNNSRILTPNTITYTQVSQIVSTVMTDLVNNVIGAADQSLNSERKEATSVGVEEAPLSESQSSVEDFEFISDDEV